jgi:acyl carrier protein
MGETMEDVVYSETKHSEAKIVQAIYDSIRVVLKRDDLSGLSPQSKLTEDLNLDSMSVIELLVTLEAHVPGFQLDAADLEASHLESVESLARYVGAKVSRP